MDTSEKAQQELEEIERQAAQMQSASGQTDETRRQLELLQQRIETLRKQLVRTNAMEKTELARHMQRPHTLDYIERIFTDWSEIHGDRRFGDDPAMVCGMARFHGDEVVVVGTEKRPRYQGPNVPQLWPAQPRGLSQGASGHAHGGEIFAAHLLAGRCDWGQPRRGG